MDTDMGTDLDLAQCLGRGVFAGLFGGEDFLDPIEAVVA